MNAPDPDRGTNVSSNIPLDAAVERLVDAALTASSNAELQAALFQEIRGLNLSERVTLWRALGAQPDPRGSVGTPFGSRGAWIQLRSIGSPTPRPDECATKGWTSTPYEVLDGGAFGALVVVRPNGAQRAGEWQEMDEREGDEDALNALFELTVSLAAPIMDSAAGPMSDAIDPLDVISAPLPRTTFPGPQSPGHSAQ